MNVWYSLTWCWGQLQTEPIEQDEEPTDLMIQYLQLLCTGQEFPTSGSLLQLKFVNFQVYLFEFQHYSHATKEKERRKRHHEYKQNIINENLKCQISLDKPQHNWDFGLPGLTNFLTCNKLNQIDVDESQSLHPAYKIQNLWGVYNKHERFSYLSYYVLYENNH